MALRPANASAVKVVVRIDEDQASLIKMTTDTVLDVICSALNVFGIEESPEVCRLATPEGQLLLPHQSLANLELDRPLFLRLPF